MLTSYIKELTLTRSVVLKQSAESAITEHFLQFFRSQSKHVIINLRVKRKTPLHVFEQFPNFILVNTRNVYRIDALALDNFILKNHCIKP